MCPKFPTALIAAGHPERSIEYLQAAEEARPDYFDSHYNLGIAFASTENFEGAAEQFGAAARLKPDDADAHANLGSALAELGRMPEAKAELERALQLNPSHTLARENLQELQMQNRNHQ